MRTQLRFFVLCILLFLSNAAAWADGPPAIPAGSAVPAGATQPPPPGIMGMVLPFVLMFAVIYFLMIRPQQNKLREQQEMLGALKHGDEVITASGILGKITGLTDKVATVEIADNVRIKILKSQISQVVKGSIKDLAQ
jgi:preprotein translocase subunit YajC